MGSGREALFDRLDLGLLLDVVYFVLAENMDEDDRTKLDNALYEEIRVQNLAADAAARRSFISQVNSDWARGHRTA